MNDLPKKRILIIGVGSIGERHVRCFQNTHRAQVSICEINDSLRNEVAERYRIDEQFHDVAAALASGCEAVVVAVPAHLHVPISQQAAEAGLHLLIEKPLAVLPDGAERLQRTVTDEDLVAVVAYVYRAHPALAAMKQTIDSGRFGRPVQLVATSGQHFPTYRPAYRETYYRDRATGGGAIQDAITHVLNAGQWLVGQIDSLIADAAHQVLEGVDVEDTVHILARHGNLLATYALNQHQAPNENMITVVCKRGTARIELHRHRWQWMTQRGGQWQMEPAFEMERDTLFIRQANAFLDAIEQKAPPLCTLAEGLHTLHVNRAALASVETKGWQDIQRTPGSTAPREIHP